MSSLTDDIHPQVVPEARRPQGAGLYLFDLDHTIVTGGSHISDRVARALGLAEKAGVVCSIASGRPLCLVSRKILRMQAFSYAICANGAKVYDLSDRSVIFDGSMDVADALAAIELLDGLGVAWNAFIGDAAYFEWKGTSYLLAGTVGGEARSAARSREAGEAPHRQGLPRRVLSVGYRGVRFLVRKAYNRRSRQVFDISRHVRQATTVDKMGASFKDGPSCEEGMGRLLSDGRFEVARVGLREIEITRAGVTKATGARHLMGHLGIDAADTVAFGDSGNDLPLASAAGTFVAVGNADAEVRAQATFVCPPISEDGVACWIEEALGASFGYNGREKTARTRPKERR